MTLVAFAIGYVITALVPNWRFFRIALLIVAVGLIWQFASLFEVIPHVVSNLVLVAALAPAWIGAAGGLLVRAFCLQVPAMTTRTRIIISVAGFVVFGALAWVLG